MSDTYKKYACTVCGNVKTLTINHDDLPVVWEKCTDSCSWSSFGLDKEDIGPACLSVDCKKTGFTKRRYIRLVEDVNSDVAVEISNKLSKMKSVVSQMERHFALNKENMPLVCEILKEKILQLETKLIEIGG